MNNMPIIPVDEWLWLSLDHTTTAILLAEHTFLAGQLQPKSFGEGNFCPVFSMGNQILHMAEAAAALRREVHSREAIL